VEIKENSSIVLKDVWAESHCLHIFRKKLETVLTEAEDVIRAFISKYVQLLQDMCWTAVSCEPHYG